MPRTLAYVRASTDKQDCTIQKYELLEYARKHGLHIEDFIEVTMSSRSSREARRLDELQARLAPDDVLLVTELSRLGRSTHEVIGTVQTLLERGVRLIALKQGLDLKNSHDMASKVYVTMFAMWAELERDFISMRTREALAAKKAQGIPLGKPQGTIQTSKLDPYRQKIVELLSYGVSVRKIAEYLQCSSHQALATYIRRRHLREEAQRMRLQTRAQEKGNSHVI
jgi:DNA invertase Pin-like site-specific DNA recombinase